MPCYAHAQPGSQLFKVSLFQFNFVLFSVESLDELLSETKKLNQTVQLKEEKVKTLENK